LGFNWFKVSGVPETFSLYTMKLKKYHSGLLLVLLLATLFACDSSSDNGKATGTLQLSVVRVGTTTLNLTDFSQNDNAPADKPVVVSFSAPLQESSVANAVLLKEKDSGVIIPLTFAYLDNNKTFSASPDEPLEPNKTFVLQIGDELKGANGETFPGHTVEFTTVPGTLTIASLMFNDVESLSSSRIQDVPVEDAIIDITFSAPLDPADVVPSNFLVSFNGANVPVTVEASDDNKKITVSATQKLKGIAKYQLVVSGEINGMHQEVFQQFAKSFFTTVDPTPVFPVISDDDLLTLVQEQTFKYFWDFAQPASGMSRERNSSGNLVTSGGSGFGIMSIIVGIERGFITRAQGLERMDRILDFLETSDRFHGAWPHWIDGNSGNVIPFSPDDNGGDLVETSFLVEGLLTFRQYLNENNADELGLINRINVLWEGVEWDWYTRGGQNVLYWHWSPDKGWIMNHQIRGWNECLITYVLAASSPTHTIATSAYAQGWTRSGAMANGKTFYSIPLPLGPDYGGPLFFSHYSFLGLNPQNLSDTYADYWEQNVNHSRINHAYVVDNPKNFVGYSDENWGLTASDNHVSYSAHSPTNDLGVISPTAALSAMPYTPEESLKAMRFFYYHLGDRLWGPYGFYDAFNLTEGWTANSYLAIDQGPIIIMIENHRTGLLWDLFMSAPEVQDGLTKLGFTY
jgi:hypothetical protein